MIWGHLWSWGQLLSPQQHDCGPQLPSPREVAPALLGSQPPGACPPPAASKTDRYPTRNFLGGFLLEPFCAVLGVSRVWPGGRMGEGRFYWASWAADDSRSLSE